MDGLVTHQGEPDVDRRLHPLVQVEREGVGAREAAHGIRGAAEGQEAADGAVDVQPHTLGVAQVGDRLDVVDRAGVDRADGGHHGERLDPGGAVGRHGGGEGVDIHREVVAHGDDAQRRLAEPEQLDRLAVAAVHLAGGVDREAATARGCRAVRTSGPIRAVRATASPTRLASEAPLTSRPLAEVG